MSLNCPYCRYPMNPRNPKPGRFTPKCPKCAGSFELVIPADIKLPWKVTALAGATDVRETQQIAGFGTPDRADAFTPTEVPALPPSAKRGPPTPTTYDRHEGTVPTQPKSAAPPPPDDREEIPAVLGGYEIEREIGRGGMGAVFLARQVSLDRDVALKIMNEKWSRDPVFLARFTREAYAAAQLVHHNVVQIYDIGEEKGIHFFSMEFVAGRSLGERVKKEGKTEPNEAVGLILQAARGLKFAHDRGMIHRDVKPDNLLLNFEGIVKVADLGLVKTPTMLAGDDKIGEGPLHGRPKGKLASVSAEMTHAFTAMGSPAYMSPEQGRDAAHVDRRADIYSLGCTLYVLLTGRPPFQGTTALEVMSKHALEEPVPPHQLVKEVPPEISAILLRMLAKNPDDRYPHMKALIADLEAFLGGTESGETRANAVQVAALESQIERFNAAPAAKLRRAAMRGVAAVCLVGGLLGITAGYPLLGLILLAALVQTFLAYFVIQGIAEKTFVFRKVRQWLFGCRFTDWLTFLAGAGLMGTALYLSGLIGVGIASAIISVLWGFAFHAALDRKLAAQRRPILDEARQLFKTWRIGGMDEEKLRGLVAKFGGKHWEEFFESLFGYEAKLQARAVLAETEGLHSRAFYAAWRDGLIERIEAIQKARREAKELKYLRGVEARKLEAEGVEKKAAKDEAEARAERMVERAAEVKAAEAAPAKTRKIVKMADAIADRAPEVAPKKMEIPLSWRIEAKLKLLIGPKMRFLIGALLIAGGSLWIKQNIDRFKVDVPQDRAAAMSALTTFFEATESARPLKLLLMPAAITDLFSYFNPLLAGLMLMMSLFFRGRLMSICFLVGAAVAFVGHRFVPADLLPFKPEACSMAAGVAIGLFGYLVSRKNRTD